MNWKLDFWQCAAFFDTVYNVEKGHENKERNTPFGESCFSKSFGNLHKEWVQQIQISLLSGEDWVKKQIQADKFVPQGMVSVKCGLSKVNNKWTGFFPWC